MTQDFNDGTIEIHLPDDENIWSIRIKNFRYETIELTHEDITYLTSAANVLIDYIEEHAKFYGDVDSLQEEG
jgi:hypothetical protein